MTARRIQRQQSVVTDEVSDGSEVEAEATAGESREDLMKRYNEVNARLFAIVPQCDALKTEIRQLSTEADGLSVKIGIKNLDKRVRNRIYQRDRRARDPSVGERERLRYRRNKEIANANNTANYRRMRHAHAITRRNEKEARKRMQVTIVSGNPHKKRRAVSDTEGDDDDDDDDSNDDTDSEREVEQRAALSENDAAAVDPNYHSRRRLYHGSPVRDMESSADIDSMFALPQRPPGCITEQ